MFKKMLFSLILAILIFNYTNAHGQISTKLEQQTASIEFTFVPAWSSFDDLTGRVWGVNPSEYYVAVYIFVESAGGWWTKPSAVSPLTPIEEDSTWTTDITTGGIDQYATKIIAFLVPDGYSPPPCVPCNELPDSLFQNPYAVDCRIPGTRVISFSGYDWIVKKSDEMIGMIGPGPNYFSDDQEDVWVDAEGLHLTITKNGTNWFATEVVADTSLGYGAYIFELKGGIDSLDQNIVLGLFTWDDCAPFDSANINENFREFDIEFSRWGNVQSDTNAQYVVQPYHNPGNIYRFNIQLSNNDTISTHRFTWYEDSIYFQSVYGDSIKEWNYTGNNVPIPGNETPRINFWLFNGQPPSDSEEVEVLITRFEYFPDKPVSLEEQSFLIRDYFLSQNYPNPFNPSTTIRYGLNKKGWVNIKVYDILGHEVITLVNNYQNAGHHSVVWDGRNNNGQSVATGIYIYRMEMENFIKSYKVLLIK